MDFEIQSTAPNIYIDKGGSAVQGFKVTAYFPAFDEVHYINVPTLDKGVVIPAVQAVYDQRKELHDLTHPDEGEQA